MRLTPIKENGQFIQHTLYSVLLCTPSHVLSEGVLDPVRQFTLVAEELMSLSENRNRWVPDLWHDREEDPKVYEKGQFYEGHDAKLYL